MPKANSTRAHDVRLSFVVAVADNGVIGRDGGLPWHLPSDLRLFRRLTLGKPIIMGRRTFQSIGRPLDHRDNIVVTRDLDFAPAGVLVARTTDRAVELALEAAARRGTDEIMVIGGGEIYAALLPCADRIYLTRVHCRPAGDTRFPDPDPADWRETSREPLPRTDADHCDATLVVFDRRSGSVAATSCSRRSLE